MHVMIWIVGALLFICLPGFFFWKLAWGLRYASPKPASPKRPGSLRVLCLGDSLLQGSVSDDVVRRLQQTPGLAAFEFLNFGSNGDIVWNLNQRLDAVIESQPDIVFVLIGTNDVRSCDDDAAAKFSMETKGSPVKPDEAFFSEQFDRLLASLVREAGLEVIGSTLPFLGEDSDSDVNQLVQRFSKQIEEICAAYNCPCLPLYDELLTALADKPPGMTSKSYSAKTSLPLIFRSAFAHIVQGHAYDDIGSKHGLYLSPDMVHLNERTGKSLVDLLAEELRERVGQA